MPDLIDTSEMNFLGDEFGSQDPNSARMNEADPRFEAAVEEDQGSYGNSTRSNLNSLDKWKSLHAFQAEV